MNKREKIQAIIENHFECYQEEEEQRQKRDKYTKAHQNPSHQIGAQDEIQQKEKRERAYMRMKRKEVKATDFEYIKQLGEGGSAAVYLVRKIDSQKIYAMKMINKKNYLQPECTKLERKIHSSAQNSWTVSLWFTFQDSQYLYLVMEFLAGGDLMGLMIRKKAFEHETVVFYISQLVLAIEEIHAQGIIHRDIKPENMMLTNHGHLKLTDFGLSARYIKNGEDASLKTKEEVYVKVGTPDYMAPEILARREYGEECDWWSVGVVVYEMFVGCLPFEAESLSEKYWKIQNWKKELKIPKEIPKKAASLIRGLLQEQETRLGATSAEEIKRHPFFNGICWNGIQKQRAPFVPQLQTQCDAKYFDAQRNVKESFMKHMNTEKDHNIVAGYSFCSIYSPEIEFCFSEDE